MSLTGISLVCQMIVKYMLCRAWSFMHTYFPHVSVPQVLFVFILLYDFAIISCISFVVQKAIIPVMVHALIYVQHHLLNPEPLQLTKKSLSELTDPTVHSHIPIPSKGPKSVADSADVVNANVEQDEEIVIPSLSKHIPMDDSRPSSIETDGSSLVKPKSMDTLALHDLILDNTAESILEYSESIGELLKDLSRKGAQMGQALITHSIGEVKHDPSFSDATPLAESTWDDVILPGQMPLSIGQRMIGVQSVAERQAERTAKRQPNTARELAMLVSDQQIDFSDEIARSDSEDEDDPKFSKFWRMRKIKNDNHRKYYERVIRRKKKRGDYRTSLYRSEGHEMGVDPLGEEFDDSGVEQPILEPGKKRKSMSRCGKKHRGGRKGQKHLPAHGVTKTRATHPIRHQRR